MKCPAAGLHPPAAFVGIAASVAASVPGAAEHASAAYSTPETVPSSHAATDGQGEKEREREKYIFIYI